MRNIKSSNIYLFFLVLVTIYSCNTTKPTPAAPIAEPLPENPLESLEVSYNSPWLAITITKGKITKVETKHYFGSDNFTATPDSMSTAVLLDAVTVKDSVLTELLNLLDQDKFWELEDSYGAPEEQRFYPYTISATQGDRSKKVIYRSNPSYGLPPEIFTKVEQFLEEF